MTANTIGQQYKEYNITRQKAVGCYLISPVSHFVFFAGKAVSCSQNKIAHSTIGAHLNGER